MKDRVCGAVIAAMVLTASCGMEDYIYLAPVSGVTATLNSSAVVRLPSSPDVITIDFSVGKIPSITISNQTKSLGSDYEIYYRIYLSDKFQPTVNTKEIRNDVNPTLEADWAAFEPYTVEANNRSSSVASLVASRKYYPIETSSSYLKRSSGNGAFNPKPSDKLWFETSDDLFNSANLTDNVNADVAGMTSGAPMYAYVSMYIMMRDFDPQTLSPVYSAPTFINVFKLPSDVLEVPVTGVTIAGNTPATPPAAIRLTANIMPNTATNKSVMWTLDNEIDAGIRILDTVDNAVIVYSKTASTKTVTVSVRTNDGGHTSSMDISLEGIAVQTFDLNLTSQTLSVGSQTTLTATVSPIEAAGNIAWSSNNTSVATVLPNGDVTAVSSGVAIITAKTTDGTEIVKTCEIIVN